MGNIEMQREFGVIEDKFSNTSLQTTHRSLQGYTAVHDNSNSHLFAMLNATGTNGNNNAEDSAYLGEVSYSTQTNLSSIKTNLYHANDCTYYDGLYFVATGRNKKIYAFSKATLKKEGEYSCDCSNMSGISSIANIFGIRFLLSQNNRISVCELNRSAKNL